MYVLMIELGRIVRECSILDRTSSANEARNDSTAAGSEALVRYVGVKLQTTSRASCAQARTMMAACLTDCIPVRNVFTVCFLSWFALNGTHSSRMAHGAIWKKDCSNSRVKSHRQPWTAGPNASSMLGGQFMATVNAVRME